MYKVVRSVQELAEAAEIRETITENKYTGPPGATFGFVDMQSRMTGGTAGKIAEEKKLQVNYVCFILQ